MRVPTRIISLWRSLFRQKQLEQDLNDELHSYLEEEIDRKIRAGASPESARRDALLEFGGMEQAKDACRDVRRMRWREILWHDFRYGLRTLHRDRSVTVIALLSLALGIGANTLVFSFMSSQIFRPLPYPELDQLVMVRSVGRNDPGRTGSLNRSNCAALQNATKVFEAFGCFTDSSWSSAGVESSGGQPAERLQGQRFTAGVPQALSISPLIGRWFTEADEQEGADLVILISHGLWQRRFGGTSDILGKTLRLDGEVATIIGVVPADFEFINSNAEYWFPFRSPAVGLRSSARIANGIGRLKPGLDIAAAKPMMDAVARSLEEQFPDLYKEWTFSLRPINDVYLEPVYFTAMLALQGAVVFVLLIACANVAGLLLAQALARQRELAVRAALGSGRWRLLRQALMHSILLTCLGGVLGMAAGTAGAQALRNALPDRLPRAVSSQELDMTVALFTLGVSLVCGLFVGIIPAIQISRAQPLDVLRESNRSATAGVSRQRLRSVFVVVQIALAFVLLIGAGVMFNSLLRLDRSPLGFDPDNLLTAGVQMPERQFRRPTDILTTSGALEMRIDPRAQFVAEQIRQNLAAVRGVASASAIAINPPLSGAITMPIRIDSVESEEPQRAQFLPVMPDYFATLQVRIVSGREFGVQDTAAALPVAVINETMARRYWPHETALGKLVQVDSPLLPNEPMRVIIGVVTDVMQYVGQQDRPQLYLPFGQLPLIHDERLSNDLRNLTFVLRTPQFVPEMASEIAAAVNRADSSQAVSSVRTMRATVYGKERQRIYVALVSSFATIAVLLAVVGVYGVMSQVVRQRTNEIGIRMALGANVSNVRRLVIRQGSVLIGAGLIIGTLGAISVTRILRGALFGIAETDVPAFLAASIALGGIAFLACYLPARRASRIDPMSALHHE